MVTPPEESDMNAEYRIHTEWPDSEDVHRIMQEVTEEAKAYSVSAMMGAVIGEEVRKRIASAVRVTVSVIERPTGDY